MRFYCTTEASSLIREVHPLSNVLFSWDVRGNYSTKSKVAECVKRLHLGCVFELQGTFEISQNCWGVGCGRVNHDKQLPFHFDKNNLKFILYIVKTKSYTEKSAIYQNRRSKRIENSHFAFKHVCTICTRVQICPRVQINLLHLESRSKFDPVQICTRVQIFKTPFTWPKYTRGANLHPVANCAYEPSFRELRTEDNSSFFNYMRMEPLMFDEILNKVSHSI